MNETLRTVAYSVVIIIGVGWLLHIGASILLPFTFALLFALFLYPIDKRIFRVVKHKWISIPLTLLAVIVPLVLIGTLFSIQLVSIIDSLPAIGSSLKVGLDQAIKNIQSVLPFLKIQSDKILSDNISSIIEAPLGILKQGLLSSSAILVSTVLTCIYSVLLLYYRRSMRNFVVFQFERQNRTDIKETISKIKDTVQAYVGGLGLVILLLSVLNSLGLWIIGIDHPIFWGALAGLLAVVPYIGTGLGGVLPFLYALATADHSWQPVAVVVYYAAIQFLEGNVITPKIVGDKVNINPLVAILALIFFGEFWGIGGVILALPIISITRIILSQFESTTPLALLMSSDVANRSHRFKEIADS